MQRTLLFKLIITSALISFSTNNPTSLCIPNYNILQCSVTGNFTVDSNLGNLNGINSINITYTGSVVLSINISSINSITIQPFDGNENDTLQISSINTTATLIGIQIQLSSNQVSFPLFTTSSYVMAPASTLSIYVIQTIPDASNFKIFDTSTVSTMTVTNYEVIFDTNVTNSGTLHFPDLIRGLDSLSSITISGNNHYLACNGSQMPISISVNQLVLKNLYLYDQILYNIINLQEYSIETCLYNRTAQFLNSNRKNNISLTMQNNNPLDLILPNGANAFLGNLTYISITLIEPQLNSSCLAALGRPSLSLMTLILKLGIYFNSDFNTWGANRPYVWYLTIDNIQTLDIFPSKFFNTIDPLHRVTLIGTFALRKQDICIFAGINILGDATPPIVVLSSSQNPQNWSNCAATYTQAINTMTGASVQCPPDNTRDDCAQWAQQTNQCSLISSETACPGITITNVKPFYYNSSFLNYFFQNRLWLNRPTNSTPPPVSNGDSMNIAAIIGAVCGLLIAIIILGITIFFIRRYRQNDTTTNIRSTPEEKYISPSSGSTNVSIATSKTSQSSRYALQRSFFPPMQPHDEVAPPLYTATSDAGGSRSAYQAPTAPSAPRDSISTHTTHVYETLDS